MKKQNVTKSVMVIALGLGFLAPKLILAEDYGTYASDVSRAGKIFEPLTALGAATSSDDLATMKAKFEEQLAAVQAKLQIDGLNADLLKEEAKFRKWIGQINDNNASLAAVDQIKSQSIDARTAKSEEVKALAANLSRNQNQFAFNPASFNLNGEASECSKGASLSPLSQIMQRFGQGPRDLIRQNVIAFETEKDEARKVAKKKLLADMFAHLNELTAKSDELESQTTKPEELLTAKTPEEKEAKLAQIKAKNAQAKKTEKETEVKAVSALSKLGTDALELQENDDKLLQVGSQFASDMNREVQFMLAAVQDAKGLAKLRKNCIAQNKKIFDPNSGVIVQTQNALLASGRSPEDSFNFAQQMAQYASENGLSGSESEACPDVTAQVEQQIISFQQTLMQDRLARITNTRKPEELVLEGSQLMDELAQLQATIGPMIDPLKQSCTKAANVAKALAAPMGQLGGGSAVASSAGGSTFRGAAARRPVGAPLNHVAGR